MNDEEIEHFEEEIKNNPKVEDNYWKLAYAYGMRYGIDKYIELWKYMLNSTGSKAARKNLERCSLSAKYEKGITSLIEGLRNLEIQNFEVSIGNCNISFNEIQAAPETIYIWGEESRLIKAFKCNIGRQKLKVFFYYAIRPEQGYMIYISFDYPQICRLEINFSKMLKQIKLNQFDILYSVMFTLHDNKNVERKQICLETCRKEGFRIISENNVYLGSFSFDNNSFINMSLNEFVKNVMKLALIKGHFGGLLRLESLPQYSYEEIQELDKEDTLDTSTYLDADIPDDILLNHLKKEIREIRSYLRGDINKEVSLEKIFFWMWFCYTFELFRDGSLIYRKINEETVNQEIYRSIKKIGQACENKIGS